MAVEEEVVVHVVAEVRTTLKHRLKHQEAAMAAAVEVVATAVVEVVVVVSIAEEVATTAVQGEDSKAAQSRRTIRTWALFMLRIGMATNEETKRS